MDVDAQCVCVGMCACVCVWVWVGAHACMMEGVVVVDVWRVCKMAPRRYMAGGVSDFMELVLLHLPSRGAGLSWKRVRLYKAVMTKKICH